LSFKEAFDILNNKKHLTEEGLNNLYNISKNMNKGRKFTNVDFSPNHSKENNIEYIPINGNYINGFIAGDGCLSLHMTKNFGTMTLSINQHNNRLLMESIAKYFKSPSKVYLGRPNDIQIVLANAQLWKDVIFEHFYKYPTYGTKKLKLNKLILIKEDNKHFI